MKQSRTLYGLMVFALILGGCERTPSGLQPDHNNPSSATPEKYESKQSSDEQMKPAASMPSGAEVSNCTNTPPEPSFCDWVSSVDAIIWGEIVEVTMKEYPAALVTDFSQVVTECSGPVDAGLQIVMDVFEIYHGTPSDRITVKVGHHQLDEWEPRPALAPSGEMVWLGGEARLEAGRMIGMAVHRSPEGNHWGLMGEVFFSESEDGRFVVQQRSICQEPAPQGLSSMTRSELGDRALGCPTGQTPSAQERMQRVRNMWSETSWAFAGLCHDGGVRYSD